MKKAIDISLILVLFLCVLIPMVFFNFKPNQISVVENRALSEPAEITDGVSEYMKSIDSYIDDRIGFRDNLMTVYNDFNYKLLNGNHPNVIKGKNGWLFYKDTLPDYTGVNVTPEKTAYQIEILKAIDNWCKERDITFILAVGPNKSSIYYEYMPDNITKAEHTNVDTVIPLLKEAGINVAYPKAALLEDKAFRENYLKLDSHWNAYGSQFMFKEIVNFTNNTWQDIPISEGTLDWGDLSVMMGTTPSGDTSVNVEVPVADNAQVVEVGSKHINISSQNTDKVIVYRDSFHIALVNYYSHYFNGDLYWRFNIDFDLVEKEKPKYLILSCAERYFDRIVAENSSVPR